MVVTFSCGHDQKVSANANGAPICVVCGERTIERVEAPAPTIRGTAAGPHVETVNLPPQAVDLKG